MLKWFFFSNIIMITTYENMLFCNCDTMRMWHSQLILPNCNFPNMTFANVILRKWYFAWHFFFRIPPLEHPVLVAGVLYRLAGLGLSPGHVVVKPHMGRPSGRRRVLNVIHICKSDNYQISDYSDAAFCEWDISFCETDILRMWHISNPPRTPCLGSQSLVQVGWAWLEPRPRGGDAAYGQAFLAEPGIRTCSACVAPTC